MDNVDKLIKIQNLKAKAAPLLEKIKQLESEIKADVLDTGEIPDVAGVTVKISSGYTRTSWDNKGLQGYAVAYPEVLQFRKETQIAPTVAISYK